MNVYKKLQKCRTELNEKKLSKSGLNKFSGYKYFELKDFLPTVNKLFYQNGLSSEFSLYDKAAVLKIIDVDNINSQIVFKVPVAEATIKGSSPIQSLGGKITYLRRYLYINALEIAESDLINKQDASNNKLTKEEEELILIYMGKMKNLEIETDTAHEEILKYFKVESDMNMDLQQLKQAVAILETKKKKNKEEVF